MATRVLYKAEELMDLQSELGKRLELFRGELVEVTTGWRHGEVTGEIYMLLAQWARPRQMGRIACDAGVILERDLDTVRRPDVSFVRRGRITSAQADHGFPELAPDFLVEVKSPNDTLAPLVRKAQEYLARGVPLVLLVHPDRFAEVHRPEHEPVRLGPDDLFVADDVLPGFSAYVRDFFPPNPE
jgi:Uma2 family endonuclease